MEVTDAACRSLEEETSLFGHRVHEILSTEPPNTKQTRSELLALQNKVEEEKHRVHLSAVTLEYKTLPPLKRSYSHSCTIMGACVASSIMCYFLRSSGPLQVTLVTLGVAALAVSRQRLSVIRECTASLEAYKSVLTKYDKKISPQLIEYREKMAPAPAGSAAFS